MAMNQTHSGSLKSLKVGPAAGGRFLQRGCPSLGYMPHLLLLHVPGQKFFAGASGYDIRGPLGLVWGISQAVSTWGWVVDIL